MKSKILKIAAAMLSVVMIVASFASCADNKKVNSSSSVTPVKPNPAVNINVAVLKGPTAIGMLKLMDDTKNGFAKHNYNFSVFTDPTLVVPEVVKGNVDIAAVPTNVAANLYHKTNKGVSVIAVNTLGVLSIVTNGESVSSIADLKGKTIYATGKGATPEYALNYILEKNGLEIGKDVKVEYKGEHSELAALVTAGEAKIAMLPQPFVTTVTNANKDVRVALDLSEEWKKISEVKDTELVMGCIVVRNEFLKKNPGAVDTFLNEYSHSTEYANEKHDKTGELSAKFDILPAAVVTLAIPRCNIVFMKNEKMKTNVSAYLKTLYDANPKSIGGALPEEAFYYVQK